ncbi:MAG: hypothetical protein KAI17_12815 [Thiotrichaceae bacterium]|nr:hypothetical protein [Thiotrichaceae bacterium]
MKFQKMTCVASVGFLLGASGFTVAQADGFKPFTDSTLYLQIRPRYEYVEGGALKDANAFTNRTILGGKFNGVAGIKGLKANLEANNVSNFGLMADYGPQEPGYNKIIDQPQTRITQANLAYTFGGTTFIAGRKMHTFDNQRFVGHVGWRQMPQTFDMIAVANNSIKGLSLTGAYVSKINRIFAADSSNPQKDKLDTNSVVLNGSYAFAKAFKLTGYGYMLSSIHDTFGLRATGSIDAGVKITYEAEYAIQDKASLKENSMGDIQPDHEADYYKLGFRIKQSGFIFGADYEVLGQKDGIGGGAFSTPLATLHAMNGWADKFLGTPVNGLVDTAITAGYINKRFGRFIVIFHNFESDKGSYDYGTETDVVYANKLSKNLNLTLKAAFYEQGDDLTNGDINKFWAMLDYKFNF